MPSVLVYCLLWKKLERAGHKQFKKSPLLPHIIGYGKNKKITDYLHPKHTTG